ncbi:hypothetical protein ABZ863_34480 [Saccharomonospora sp. NPDC046836]|uniref:hypothetical protein n=1 Tax=Saccharomonospora sp. NPDC046836 TaxID=3156921 RepID=UPI0033C7E83E
MAGRTPLSEAWARAASTGHRRRHAAWNRSATCSASAMVFLVPLAGPTAAEHGTARRECPSPPDPPCRGPARARAVPRNLSPE